MQGAGKAHRAVLESPFLNCQDEQQTVFKCES